MNVMSITCKNVADAIEAGLTSTDIIAEVARRIKNKGGKMSKSHRRIIAAVRDAVDVDDTVLDTIGADSDAMSGHNVHVRSLEEATYDDLATRQAELDRTLWGRCLAKCEEVHVSGGARWAAYSLMDEMGIPRPRIAAAAGCTNVNSVTQGISKHRRGIKPDLSFVGK